MWLLLLLVISPWIGAEARADERIRRVRSVPFRGELLGHDDISCVARFGDYLVIGSDESRRQIQVLKKAGAGYAVHGTYPLLAAHTRDGDELDVEALALEGTTLYVLGSHARNRTRAKVKASQRTNHGRIARVANQATRSALIRCTVDRTTGTIRVRDRISLGGLIKADPVLRPFLKLPSKENGVDLEGLAVRDGTLFIGFRGPVLRQNHVPVMVLDYDAPAEREVRYVRLDGFGIRALARTSRGFLLVAGPVGDADLPCRLYQWDGSDGIIGKDAPAAPALLGTLPAPAGGKAEGLEVLEETDRTYRILVLYDSATRGGAQVLDVDKPAG